MVEKKQRIEYLKLNEVMEKVNEVISQFPDMDFSDFEFGTEWDYGDDKYPILTWHEPETDEEMKDRQEREKKYEEKRLILKKLQYEALKKEFGG